LQEYFCFPQKFFFLDLTGLDQLRKAGFGKQAEVVLLISPFERADRRQMLELGVSEKTFRLGCAPIVNLFPHTAEPILMDHARSEYPVVPDVGRRLALEVFEISGVVSANPQTGELVRFEPFYSYRHATTNTKVQAFWHATRRESGYGDGAFAGGPFVAPRTAERGQPHGAHDLHQSRFAVEAAVRQRGGRFRAGERAAAQAHRGGDQAD
jgi:type VI secretion system protein ImpG